MYEDKKKQIDWKALLIKLIILLIVVFVIIWIVSLLKNNNELESNLSSNLQELKSTAIDYFREDNLPKDINEQKKVTLGELIDNKQIIELIDEKGNACDRESSYIEATRINDTLYTIKVKLVCGESSDYLIDNVSYEVKEDSSSSVENKEDSDTNSNDTTVSDNTTNNTQDDGNIKIIVSTDTNTTPSASTNASTNTQNDNTEVTLSANTNTTSNTSTVTSTNTNSTNSTNKKVDSKVTCTYGSLNAESSYPVAYKISGNCAVSKAELSYGMYSNKASDIGTTEYVKLAREINDLSSKTGIEFVISPDFIPAINKEGTGYVGYLIKYTVRIKSNDTIVYAYYIDSNYNRVVLTDNRSKL